MYGETKTYCPILLVANTAYRPKQTYTVPSHNSKTVLSIVKMGPPSEARTELQGRSALRIGEPLEFFWSRAPVGPVVVSFPASIASPRKAQGVAGHPNCYVVPIVVHGLK